MVAHVKILVTGRVQGVFFRVSTQGEASRLGLNGFVQNEADGSVYIEVEGQNKQIDELLDWLKKGGPPLGRVDDVDVVKGDIKNFTGFDIR